jgi:hypothetical protein
MHLPFGGAPGTRSGIGRVGGRYALEELSVVKSILIASAAGLPTRRRVMGDPPGPVRCRRPNSLESGRTGPDASEGPLSAARADVDRCGSVQVYTGSTCPLSSERTAASETRSAREA